LVGGYSSRSKAAEVKYYELGTTFSVKGFKRKYLI